MTEQTTTTSSPQDTPRNLKNAVPDIAGILERFKLPGFDLDGFVASRKQDIDAVREASSAAFAGAQTIVEKQAELLKTVLAETADALKSLPEGATTPAEFVHKQQELANEALSSALKSMREIAETARKSQSDILEIATNRVRSSVEEIRNLAKRPEPQDSVK
jgi:phasin family protein